MRRILLGAVGVLALQALFFLGYLVLYTPDPLVEKGIRKVVVCGHPPPHESRARMYQLMEEGSWGHYFRGGPCTTWLHYVPEGPAAD